MFCLKLRRKLYGPINLLKGKIYCPCFIVRMFLKLGGKNRVYRMALFITKVYFS